MKRIVEFLLAAVIFILPLGAVDLYGELADASPSLMPASIGGDWTVVALARADRLEKSLADTYYVNAVEYVAALDGVLHQSRYTEYSRMILALGAIGRDPRDVGGYDLVKPLGDFDAVIKQGMNGAAWALIALDSNGYQISYPTGVKTRTTRDKLIEHILGYQQADGSFAGWRARKPNTPRWHCSRSRTIQTETTCRTRLTAVSNICRERRERAADSRRAGARARRSQHM